MTRKGEIAYLVFRLICYGALIVVVTGIAIMVALSVLDLCPRLDTGSVSCNTPFQEELATVAMGIMLVTVFTGIPTLLALAGAFFLIRGLYRRFGPAPSPDAPEGGGAKRALRIVLKYVLILFGVVMLIGFIAGLVEGVRG
ncbi:MAG: hypothetical protein ACR2PM_03730 [Hyphomicrobiales bacterium]